MCAGKALKREVRVGLSPSPTDMVSSSEVGDCSRSQRDSLAQTVLLVLDRWWSRSGVDSALHLALEDQGLDAAMERLGRPRGSRQGVRATRGEQSPAVWI
jgi:hypothetical protein